MSITRIREALAETVNMRVPLAPDGYPVPAWWAMIMNRVHAALRDERDVRFEDRSDGFTFTCGLGTFDVSVGEMIHGGALTLRPLDERAQQTLLASPLADREARIREMPGVLAECIRAIYPPGLEGVLVDENGEIYLEWWKALANELRYEVFECDRGGLLLGTVDGELRIRQRGETVHAELQPLGLAELRQFGQTVRLYCGVHSNCRDAWASGIPERQAMARACWEERRR